MGVASVKIDVNVLLSFCECLVANNCSVSMVSNLIVLYNVFLIVGSSKNQILSEVHANT